jgi:NhaA family Na+:H+ antiporter
MFESELRKFGDNIRRFMRVESAGGVTLLRAAVLAMVLKNSPLGDSYVALLEITAEVRVGTVGVDKPLFLWINDGLMAVFFFLGGMEIKREAVEGYLSERSQIVLPGLAALGGMVVPAAIYVACTWGDSEALAGWAIPTATDIAFALGVLALLGSRAPVALKVFLMTLAILDDLGAIIVIALFYTADLSPAGVVTGLAIPARAADEHAVPPLRHLVHELRPWVAFAILPLFAFANAGVGYARADRLAIIIGSLISGLLGYGILRFASARPSATEDSV